MTALETSCTRDLWISHTFAPLFANNYPDRPNVVPCEQRLRPGRWTHSWNRGPQEWLCRYGRRKTFEEVLDQSASVSIPPQPSARCLATRQRTAAVATDYQMDTMANTSAPRIWLCLWAIMSAYFESKWRQKSMRSPRRVSMIPKHSMHSFQVSGLRRRKNRRKNSFTPILATWESALSWARFSTGQAARECAWCINK